MVTESEKQLAAYYHWLRFGDLFTELEHWLIGEKMATNKHLYAAENKAYWEAVERIRTEKEAQGYEGPRTTEGRPAVYGYELQNFKTEPSIKQNS